MRGHIQALIYLAGMSMTACSIDTPEKAPPHPNLDGSWLLKWHPPKEGYNRPGIKVNFRPSANNLAGNAPQFFRVDLSERDGRISNCNITASDFRGRSDPTSNSDSKADEVNCFWKKGLLSLKISTPGKGSFTFELRPAGARYKGEAKVDIAGLPVGSLAGGQVSLSRLNGAL